MHTFLLSHSLSPPHLPIHFILLFILFFVHLFILLPLFLLFVLFPPVLVSSCPPSLLTSGTASASPCPRQPSAPNPQVNTRPSAVSATLCRRPHAILTIDSCCPLIALCNANDRTRRGRSCFLPGRSTMGVWCMGGEFWY